MGSKRATPKPNSASWPKRWFAWRARSWVSRLHIEDLSVEQGVRFFREEAYLEESTARREAERGTFDPQYVLYALGKMMLLQLRADCKSKQGEKFSLQGFHDQLLGQGNLPFWAHRELMLGESGTLLE